MNLLRLLKQLRFVLITIYYCKRILRMNLHYYLVNTREWTAQLWPNCRIFVILLHFRYIWITENDFFEPLKVKKVILMTKDCFWRTLLPNLHGYLLNYWGMNSLFVAYLSDVLNFSSFKVNLPTKVTFLHSLKQ